MEVPVKIPMKFAIISATSKYLPIGKIPWQSSVKNPTKITIKT